MAKYENWASMHPRKKKWIRRVNHIRGIIKMRYSGTFIGKIINRLDPSQHQKRA